MILLKNEQLENEIQKELEKENEKARLEEVINVINTEILSYISKRKFVAEEIQEYREKALEEYRDDEDKVAEYFDHEKFIKEESFKALDRKLKELTILSPSPYFGRVDFLDNGTDEESIYIGRFGLTPENSLEPLVVDWRAPIAALFYTGKLGKISYEAPLGKIEADIVRKRQFVIKKQQLKGMFDSEMDVKDEILQMVLSSSSGEKLKDIIMTIQAEQDNIIRQDRFNTVVVNGVAGSGKTTIALHRVAYLLYNFRDSLQDKVLILGPNRIFIEYISMVLPSLGEVGVSQTTFINFACELLNIDDVMDYNVYMEKMLSDDEDFKNEHIHKISKAYIKDLDELVKGIENDYFKLSDIKWSDKTIVSKSELEEMFYNYYKNMPLFRRSKKVKRIVFSKLKDYRDELIRVLNNNFKKQLAAMSKEELELNENQQRFLRKARIREIIKQMMDIKKSLPFVHTCDIDEIYNKFNDNKQLTIDDLSPLLYLRIKLDGMKYKREIKHIVIDEAQDFSELQFLVLKELTGCSGFTIVGDTRQRLIPVPKGEQIPMLQLEEIYKGLKLEHFELLKSYRSTREIMSFANKFLNDIKDVPMVRSGEEVVTKKFTDQRSLAEEIVNTIASTKDKGYESVAIICKSIKETELLSSLLSDKEYIKVFKAEEMIYTSGVMIIPSYFAKGLEFDAAIVVLSDETPEDGKLNYVMATRALHELFVYSI